MFANGPSETPCRGRQSMDEPLLPWPKFAVPDHKPACSEAVPFHYHQDFSPTVARHWYAMKEKSFCNQAAD